MYFRWINIRHFVKRTYFPTNITLKPRLVTEYPKCTVFAPNCHVKKLSTVADENLPRETRVLICGGGVVGTSLAYHLSEKGCKDVVLIEQGSLGCGTSWHAAGLIGQLRAGPFESAIAQYSRQLYERFEEQDLYVGWKRCGSLWLARTKNRMTLFRRSRAIAMMNGVECHMVTPDEIRALFTLARTDDLEGGLHIPSDGVVSPTDLINTFAKLARDNGVKIIERCRVTKVNTDNGRVSSVQTNMGNVKCEVFVNCSGMWSHHVGKLSEPSVAVPLHACEHFYIVTKPIPGFPTDESGIPSMPVVRDYDGWVYFREYGGGGIMAGGFEPIPAKPVFHTGIPDKFEHSLLPDDWNQFSVLIEQIMHRVPALQNTEVQQLLNGPESFTPDGRFIIGKAPEIQNYFVAAGMNSLGIVYAGGIGKYLADHIADGRSSVDMWRADICRFHPLQNNLAYLRDTCPNTVGSFVSVPIPSNVHSSSEPLRVSPLYATLQQHGAVFMNEREYACPLYFVKSNTDRQRIMDTKTFSKPAWFDVVGREYRACREGVAIADTSSVTKIRVTSENDDACKFLQLMCSSNVDIPVGSAVQTTMLHEGGGTVVDCAISRLDQQTYLIIMPSIQQTRINAWLKRHLPGYFSVVIDDVTSLYSCLNVIGPHAQDLLNDVASSSEDISTLALMTTREIGVGHLSGVRVLRWTMCGEAGYTLFTPNELTTNLYTTLKAAGAQYEIQDTGRMALQFLHADHQNPVWGVDYGETHSPLQCGLASRVDLEKGDFIGRDAVIRDQSEGTTEMLVQFVLNDHDAGADSWPWGWEPIFRNSLCIGATKSSAYSYDLGKMLCWAMIRHVDPNTQQATRTTKFDEYIHDSDVIYTINIAGNVFTALPRV